MVGRSCSICSSGTDVRRGVDSALMTGSSFRVIAQQFEVSPDAVRRHLLNHVSDDVKSALAESQSIDGTGLVLRISEIADAAKETRQRLTTTGKDRDALRAGDSELRALTTLVMRLGISDSTLLESATQAVELGFSLISLMRTYPELELGALLVEELRDRGSDELADSFATINSRIINKEVTQ